jgi:hypothetical protein
MVAAVVEDVSSQWEHWLNWLPFREVEQLSPYLKILRSIYDFTISCNMLKRRTTEAF